MDNFAFIETLHKNTCKMFHFVSMSILQPKKSCKNNFSKYQQV